MLLRALALVVLVMLPLVCGCRPRPAPEPPPTPPQPVKPLSAESAAVSQRNLRFACDLFSKLQAETPKENLFISPLSVSVALGMTANGAAGTTREAMMQALQWQGLTMEQVNEALRTVKAGLQEADKAVTLTIADSLWANQDVAFKPEFLEVNRTVFDAEVDSLDFGDPASAKRINDWVKEQTNGLIPDITDAESLADLWLVLLDAVYFKGEWTEPFEKRDTEEATFTLLQGEKAVPMMKQENEFRYLEAHKLQAVALPYGSGRIEMIVVLPAADANLADFCLGLNGDDLGELLQGLASREGMLKLPRFTACSDCKLNDVLTALGMGEAFDRDRADLSAMCEGDAWIDLVRQKSYVEVDEEGTEAAAVTEVGVAGAAAPPPGEPFEMIVNRPFFFLIRDAGTQAVLFMGAIVDPEQ
jgi:serine protease inhibitor